MEGLIAAQIRVEVTLRMDRLERRRQNSTSSAKLYAEINDYLSPWTAESRDRIIKIALEKMEGVSSTADLAAKVTEAAEGALLEEFHKGIDKQMRGYMK